MHVCEQSSEYYGKVGNIVENLVRNVLGNVMGESIKGCARKCTKGMMGDATGWCRDK